MKQEQCPKCGRPYLRARNGDPPAECRSCKTSLRPQATEPKPLPGYASPIPPKPPVPPVGPIGPGRGRGGLLLAKVTGLGAVGLLLLTIIVGVVLVVRKPEAGGGVDEPASSAAQVADSGTSSEPASGAGSGGQSPGATDSGTSAPPDSMASRWGMSQQIKCTDVVFGNSIIGLDSFDEAFLKDGDASKTWSELSNEIGQTPYGENWHSVMEADLLVKVGKLVASRPLFEIGLVPDSSTVGDAVGVWLQATGASAEVFELSSQGTALVSASADINLDPGVTSADMARGTNRLPLRLPWNHEVLQGLTSERRINVVFTLRFIDGSTLSKPWQFELRPGSEVETVYPWYLGYATCANETHPWVRELLTAVSNDPTLRAAGGSLVGGGGNKCDQLFSVYLIWRELCRRQLRYSNQIAAATNAQRVRLFDEALRDKNANCVDGSALIAGLLEGQAIDACLVFTPGHCLLGFVLSGEIVLLETTVLSRDFSAEEEVPYSRDFLQHCECDDARTTTFLSFASEPSFASFFKAIEYGQANWETHNIVELREAFNAAWSKYSESKTDTHWRALLEAAQPLSKQLQIVPIEFARRLGVKPITPPANLGPLPK